jgi:hypothetical protein
MRDTLVIYLILHSIFSLMTIMGHVSNYVVAECVLPQRSHINDSKYVPLKDSLRIGILYLFKVDITDIRFKNTWDDALVNRVVANRMNYAARYSYDLINASEFIDRKKPTAWSKFLALDRFLTRYDYLFYTDMDLVIMNFNISLESLLKVSNPNADFIMTSDWNGLNSGVFFVKNSTWSSWFLQWAFKQEKLVKAKDAKKKSYPFEYEQRAFHYYLNTKAWQRAGVKSFKTNVTTEERNSHFYFLPQCAMNSYGVLNKLGQKHGGRLVSFKH